MYLSEIDTLRKRIVVLKVNWLVERLEGDTMKDNINNG